MKVGILGAGQLAMMLAEAAVDLDIEVLCFTDQHNTPASYSAKIVPGALSDMTALQQFAAQVDVITLENEFIQPEVLNYLQTLKPVYPDVNALRATQDRLIEKQLLQKLAIPCAEFVAIDQFDQLTKYADLFDYQAILKTRQLGYDGKGQYRIQSKQDLPQLDSYQQLILERLIPFDYEVSLIAARNVSGDIIYYPLTKNTHEDGILRISEAPLYNKNLQQQAERYTHNILDSLEYTGVIAVEFFVVNQEQLYANEIAPRVHNSGHWTIEGSKTSQFTNHLLAITNQQLGDTSSCHARMVNLIGTIPDPLPEGVLHDYHKTPRPKRKLGHVTKIL